MKYLKINEAKIQIIPEDIPIEEMLLRIARLSYDTSDYRGFGFLAATPPYLPNFGDYIEYEGFIQKSPKMLFMDYINGRDCRTKVYKDKLGTWYLDSHVFQQRKVTEEEFAKGIVRDSAEEFLDKVIQSIVEGRR